MKKYNIDTTEKIIPDCFLSLIESNLIDENNIEKTDDGFFCLNKCISDILAQKGIYTFPTSDGDELKCENYYDDWYIYALKEETALFTAFSSFVSRNTICLQARGLTMILTELP